ncbi:hypothetical protein LOK49_LG02G03170 [Camellia lanceoleosa]|uniref:Uncharacterized protein n=1 Tax=Camellia lanceoleosa TaxID=1840588 RepID=A0ACC0IQM4_9ERIC|nr:hypothetical protein LOK49_LG02G03170 [Camellia lanceoleosa]
MKMMSCGGLPKRRHQDKGSEDDDDDDDVEDLFGIEEAEESDEAETTSDDSDKEIDDDAMFHMDTYLARILKEHKNLAGGETAHS